MRARGVAFVLGSLKSPGYDVAAMKTQGRERAILRVDRVVFASYAGCRLDWHGAAVRTAATQIQRAVVGENRASVLPLFALTTVEAVSPAVEIVSEKD